MRPTLQDYPSFYAPYISQIQSDDLPSLYTEQMQELVNVFSDLTAFQIAPYAEGKWSLKDLLGHIIDAERVFAYRAMRAARKDTTPLPGFEEDDWVANGGFNARTMPDLVQEFITVRKASIALLHSIPTDRYGFRINANEKEITLGAILYIIVGHVTHHMNVVEERYINR